MQSHRHSSPSSLLLHNGAFSDTAGTSHAHGGVYRSGARSSWHGSALSDVSHLTMPLGRLLFSLIFLMAVPAHFTAKYADLAAQQGVPFANILVPFSGMLAAVGALSVLLGYHAKTGALLLVLFLVPVTLMMHNFWAVSDPMMRQMQQGHFMKNLGLIGGALFLMHCGSGEWSLDHRRR